MKKLLLIMTFVLLGCVPPHPYPPAPVGSSNSAPSSEPEIMAPPPSTESKPANTLSRDAADCERQAALSTVGTKAEAFNNCMKARRSPN